MHFEIYKGYVFIKPTGEWYWRLRVANGRIMADGGEGYSTRTHVIRAINRITDAVLAQGHRLPIKETES